MPDFAELSFREKSALVSLLAVLFVYGGYFADLLSRAFEPTLGAMLFASVGVIIALVVIEVCFHIALAILGSRGAAAPPDERDRLIRSRATRFSHLVLSIGVVMVLCRVVIQGAIYETTGKAEVTLFEVANLLLFSIVLSAVVYYGAQVFFYRRGIHSP